MRRYEKLILNGLLDSYESSLLYTGKNKVNIRVSFPFMKKNLPEYFDESSVAYEEIHAAMLLLEQKGFIEIVWKKQNHIVQKVLLNEACLEEVYCYVGRTSKAVNANNTLQLLQRLRSEVVSETCWTFIDYLEPRIRDGRSVKEYIELDSLHKTEQLILAVDHVEVNKEASYIREFSIQHFSDSKVFESLLPLIGKVMRNFNERLREMDIYAILAEYFIYHTPNYVYLKGSSGILELGESRIMLKGLRQGIGICGDDLSCVNISGTKQIRKVITIENLTTFFRWSEADSLLIYLGGYHNGSRRRLLQLIYEQIPGALYLHFGDIDAGGFEIYEDLKRRTGIFFQTYHMGLDTFKKYEMYARELTANDRKRIQDLLGKEISCAYSDVLRYMLERNKKLEQECIGYPSVPTR